MKLLLCAAVVVAVMAACAVYLLLANVCNRRLPHDYDDPLHDERLKMLWETWGKGSYDTARFADCWDEQKVAECKAAVLKMWTDSNSTKMD